jgi:hypothetical protein
VVSAAVVNGGGSQTNGNAVGMGNIGLGMGGVGLTGLSGIGGAAGRSIIDSQ